MQIQEGALLCRSVHAVGNDFKIDLMKFSTWGDSQIIDDALGLTSISAYCFYSSVNVKVA